MTDLVLKSYQNMSVSFKSLDVQKMEINKKSL